MCMEDERGGTRQRGIRWMSSLYRDQWDGVLLLCRIRSEIIKESLVVVFHLPDSLGQVFQSGNVLGFHALSFERDWRQRS